MSNKTPEKFEMKGNWNEFKSKLKRKYPQLTDKDLMYDQGQKEDMFTMLQVKLGKTKEDLTKVIQSL